MMTERPLSVRCIFKSFLSTFEISKKIHRQFVVVSFNSKPKSNRLKFQFILRLINKGNCLGVRGVDDCIETGVVKKKNNLAEYFGLAQLYR